MDFTHIPFVHPRVIEISRHGRAFSISVGAGRASGASQSECGPGEPEVVTVETESGSGLGAGSFGVKRPLRFLAYKLGLSEPQVTELAAILDELKTERAQAAVDDRRTLSAFAEAISGEAFDDRKAADGAALRKKSAERLDDAVVKALGRIHKLLTPQQRERFAYLIRTGTVLL
jgi:Spy/CpxP family protein refolding chaperone